MFGSELAERMERADQLRPFDIVYVRCDYHPGRFHRGVLFMRMPDFWGETSNGIRCRESGWELQPHPKSHPPGRLVVTDSSVPQGYVWRVVDELRDDPGAVEVMRADEAMAKVRARSKSVPETNN